MAVDLLALFSRGLWSLARRAAPDVEILAPFDVEVAQDVFEVTVDFVNEED